MPASFKPIRLPKRSPLVSQVLVIKALFIREVATRFGEYRLGFFWMLFEPILGVVVIGLVIGTLAARTVPEIPYPFFVLNGMVFLRVFTGPMNDGMNAINSNQGLLVYPTVRPLDPFIARFMFDLITSAFSFILFCMAGMWWGIPLSLGHLHYVAIALLLTWMSGCGFGLIFGVAAAHFKEVEKIIPVLQRPLLFVSAVMFPMAALPEHAQDLLLHNPLVHTIELSRKALFPLYHSGEANFVYPTSFAIIVLAMGLAMFQNSKDFLSQR
ncbi:MAG: hypothetical protein EOP88_03035 [Verrucomicrobiaceae bacterium]|nr:MAG: hypothetical protein EOP88_03035 [Verrucomicrobiaceae bacterium]